MAVWVYIVLTPLAAAFLYSRQIIDFIRRRQRLVNMVDKLPGPFSIPVLGTTWMFKWQIAALAQQLLDWGEYYSEQGFGLVRIWMSFIPMVGFIRPEAAKVLFDSNEFITKGKEYDILRPWLGDGLLTSTGSKWRSRRKMLTPSFHFNVLNDFLITHDYQSKILMEQLEPLAGTGDEFNIFPYLKRCALDIICETSMGTTVEAQVNHCHPYVMAVQRMNEIAFIFQRMPWLWIKAIWYMTGYGFEYDHNLKIVTDFTKKVIAEKGEEYARMDKNTIDRNKKKAFLNMLMEIKLEGKLNDEDIREEVDTFMFEGHDTTSSSMGWTLWCISHNPDVQEKIIAEMDEIFGTSDRDCTNEDLKLMKYLERCIKESMRMFPPVPVMTRAIFDDLDINGTVVPKDSVALLAPILIHRNKTVWEHPNTYNPDNFLEENISKRHPYAFVPFSVGPRNCIGQKFAMMEEKTVLSWFFRRYRCFATIPFEDNKPCPEIIMKPSIGFPVRLEKR